MLFWLALRNARGAVQVRTSVQQHRDISPEADRAARSLAWQRRAHSIELRLRRLRRDGQVRHARQECPQRARDASRGTRSPLLLLLQCLKAACFGGFPSPEAVLHRSADAAAAASPGVSVCCDRVVFKPLAATCTPCAALKREGIGSALPCERSSAPPPLSTSARNVSM